MTKKTPGIILFMGLSCLIIFASCSGAGQNSGMEQSNNAEQVNVAGQKKVEIVASFYPLAEFARQVGGAGVDVKTVVSPGTEPHDFEPTPHDIAGINDATVFIYNGGTLDPWAKKISSELSSKTRSLDMTVLLKNESADPHFWLDPVIAQKEVDVIRDALAVMDPSNAQTYNQNAAAYIESLRSLDKEFSSTLSSCATREIFTSHAAFSYLAARYGLTQVSIAGLSPDAEPSARRLADLATQAKAQNIKYIFFETLTSPRLADTLSNAIGAQTLVLNPLEGLTPDEVKSGMDYLSVMRQNLANLKTALECK